jgi:hypothetical protein
MLHTQRKAEIQILTESLTQGSWVPENSAAIKCTGDPLLVSLLQREISASMSVQAGSSNVGRSEADADSS